MVHHLWRAAISGDRWPSMMSGGTRIVVGLADRQPTGNAGQKQRNAARCRAALRSKIGPQ
jgi:hypothetical protein